MCTMSVILCGMAKSKAQRMKEYRERQKEQMGEREWLRRERERTKSYRKPISNLSEEKLIKRRDQNRRHQHVFRQKKRKAMTIDNNNNVEQARNVPGNPTASTSRDDISDESELLVSSSTDSRLTVKLNFRPTEGKGSGGTKRASRALAKSYRRIETLEDKCEALNKKLSNARKRLARMEAKKVCNTPRSKTDKLLKKSGLTPQTVPEIRKKLLYNECLNEELTKAKHAQGRKHKLQEHVHRIASGAVIKKYRLKASMENNTGLNRRRSYKTKVINPAHAKQSKKWKSVKEDIVHFLERDDNSRMMPGKADAVKCGKENEQKRVLNDYMHNLHEKFAAESTYKISRAAFCKCRPPNISLVNFTARSVCLCSRHQNFSFITRTLKNLNLTKCTSPDEFVNMYKESTESLDQLLEGIPTDADIKFQQWKRVTLKNGKQRQRVVEVEKPRNEFIAMVKESFKEFKGHVQRVREQYIAIRDMKAKLPDNHVLIQMDFAENYTCQTLEEIQSAYWNSCMVTLHPTVIYYKSNSGELQHSSYVYVSEVLHHNAAMVTAIIEKIMAVVKRLVPDIHAVHFWTDSPSSQYRNKTIFDYVGNFCKRYGTTATWHYFEAGHGKGPCDGVGGTTKRSADNAVKQGKALIQDASDFFAWASQQKSDIKYELITETEYEKSKLDVDKRNSEIKPLSGSMQLHAVCGTTDGRLMVRDTSCACDNCFAEGSFNDQSQCVWNIRQIEHISDKIKSKQEKTAAKSQTSIDGKGRGVAEAKDRDVTAKDRDVTAKDRDVTAKDRDVTAKDMDVTAKDMDVTAKDMDVTVDTFVLAKYEGKCYVGRICEMDQSDNTVLVNFMAQSGKYSGHLKWPQREDKLWIKIGDIVMSIDKPVPTGKTGRMFAIAEDVIRQMII